MCRVGSVAEVEETPGNCPTEVGSAHNSALKPLVKALLSVELNVARAAVQRHGGAGIERQAPGRPSCTPPTYVAFRPLPDESVAAVPEVSFNG